MKEVLFSFWFVCCFWSFDACGQKGEDDKSKLPPYCFAEISTYLSFDDQAAFQLRKEFSMRYSNINILMSKQKIQFHICGKTELKVEDKMIRDIMEKNKIAIVSVLYSFIPFETKNICEYPECE